MPQTSALKAEAQTANAQEAQSLLDSRLEGSLEDDRKKFVDQLKPLAKDPETRRRVDVAVGRFISLLVSEADIVTDDALETLAALIQKLDEKLSEQVNLIIHHPDFQKLEGSWRGLEHLVYATETDKQLKIRLLNISKNDLKKEFKKYKGASWDKSELFKKIYTQEYGTAGGQPYGVLIGDYEFANGKEDVDILKGMAQLAAVSHAPFIAGTDPAMLELDDWTQFNPSADYAKVLEGPEWATWRGFRESLDARYVGLTLPRFLSRMPYGKDNKVEGFDFVETCEGGDHSKYTWSNASYALGANITQAFKYYGWTACIRGKNSGGAVTGLNVHTFPTDDGGVDMKCPTEVSVPDQLEHELAKLGLSAIVHWKNTDKAAFLAVPSVYQTKEFYDPDATANSKLNGALPYMFVVSRFAHFLKHMVREAIGSFTTREGLERWLHNWLANYVTDDENASDKTKAEKPLFKAEVTVEDVPGQPGYYTAVFKLQPHYQLEGITASLRLVAKKSGAKLT